ncbi:MAG: tRNA-intron lyase [Thaumarchaeota archaeon]|nr:tRNA-intron lyase [Nitrososphaerota archaeon]
METSPAPTQKLEEANFEAVLEDGKVFVSDKSRFGELEESGYGMKEGKRLLLKDYEALYLLYAQKLKLTEPPGKEVSFQELSERAERKSKESWTRFIIYRDLRSRGYIVKEGFGFGTDLRVYERGDFPRKAAKYVVFALDEGIETGVDDLLKSVKEIAKMGKEAIIAVIERRGEVIYYKISKARFNK